MICKTFKEILLGTEEIVSVAKCFTLQAQGPEFESPVPIQKAGHGVNACDPRARGWWRQKDPWNLPAILVKSVSPLSQKIGR